MRGIRNLFVNLARLTESPAPTPRPNRAREFGRRERFTFVVPPHEPPPILPRPNLP